ncbi:hypothetical protein JHK85_039641 [Glycine max]|nr:hypothetical protein JHK85_039641 [Glycine max]
MGVTGLHSFGKVGNHKVPVGLAKKQFRPLLKFNHGERPEIPLQPLLQAHTSWPHGVSSATVSVSALAHDLFRFDITSQVQAGRELVPTTLGITLVRGYQTIDPDLCLPDVRSFIEQQITLIAKGQVDHGHVVQHVIQQFTQKFSYFVKKIEHMDALFEAQFSTLTDSGRILSKCGKCLSYMKYIFTQPSRLYCGTCEEVYYLPQKGTIKLVDAWKEAKPPPKTPDEAARLVIQTLKRHQKADVEESSQISKQSEGKYGGLEA